ncbi:proton pump-interactor 1 [Hevea brasiliensis]|uniref:proton pump-interactor 1 n=1 Tax=Hevea brasiliensis TaxID=3981 RepID=UPI0025DCAA1C|nr:proton pump-interactor 1 [Hevea brasiliensis]
MGVEVGGSEMAQVPVETVTEVDNSFLHDKENGKLDKESGFKPIKFGSHEEEPAKGEGDEVADSKFPTDAADEWPAPKQIHTFYFVRYRPFDDPKIKAKIDQYDREIQKSNQSRFQITEELKAKRSERAELLGQVKALRNENVQYKTIFNEKKKEIEPLQQALGKLRNTNNAGRGGLCSSEEELNDLIYSLQYRIQHESIPLTEEKQILREIKQLEGTREKVIANAAMRAKIQDSLGQKEAIQDQVKLMGVDLDGVKKEQQAVWGRINQLREKVSGLDFEIKSLQDDLTAVMQKRDKAYDNIKSLRQQRDEGNVHFYNSRKTMTEAKDLAAKKDIKALEELSCEEVDKFMSLWSNNKAFRDDYEKRILPSLDSRQLSRDGRIRNADEKPLVVLETAVPSEPEPVAKANIKRVKEEPKSTPQKDTLPTQKVQKESSKTDSKATSEHIDVADEISGSEKQQKNHPVKKEIDEAKLKELKREEEMEKAKQAMERKKKLAEKAAAKAAIKAQKEAEKKLQEREKKLKKKAAASASMIESEDPAEEVAEETETEKFEVHDEPPASVKAKVKKENSVKHRIRSRGTDSLPKAILRRKKSTNYWMWAAAAAAAALLLLVLVALGYYYLL